MNVPVNIVLVRWPTQRVCNDFTSQTTTKASCGMCWMIRVRLMTYWSFIPPHHYHYTNLRQMKISKFLIYQQLYWNKARLDFQSFRIKDFGWVTKRCEINSHFENCPKLFEDKIPQTTAEFFSKKTLWQMNSVIDSFPYM